MPCMHMRRCVHDALVHAWPLHHVLTRPWHGHTYMAMHVRVADD